MSAQSNAMVCEAQNRLLNLGGKVISERDAQTMVANSAKAQQEANRAKVAERLRNASFNGVIDELFREVDAKNQAYFFIMEMGLLGEFKTYCEQ